MLAGWPAWAKWLAAFFATLAACALVGRATPLGAGNAIFLGGAVAIFASLVFIRLGGPKALVGRDRKGKPIFDLDPERRRKEIRRGAALFLLGAALWAVLIAVTFFPR